MSTVFDICPIVTADPLRQIPYEDLQKCTNDWDPSTILGKGGYGTVYKGTWNSTQIAIKRIENRVSNSEGHDEKMKEVLEELNCINAYIHENVLGLFGHCKEGPHHYLIHEYMPGGSLEDRLKVEDPSKVLKWHTRRYIAIGISRGLHFLHTIGDTPLIHANLKSSNILLDVNDSPRIGGVGLARKNGYAHITEMPASRPYLPPEVLRGGGISTKTDTYSFGIIFFELATGQPAYSDRRNFKYLKDHVIYHKGDILDLKDPRTGREEKGFERWITFGKRCVQDVAKDRPEPVDVPLYWACSYYDVGSAFSRWRGLYENRLKTDETVI